MDNKQDKEFNHIPVMLKEVIEFLKPVDNGIYVDATFGGGGYTKAILDVANCTVIALDQDPDTYNNFLELQKQYHNRLFYFNVNFSQLEAVLAEAEIEKIDGIVFDLGVSSFQLDTAERGFSFMHNGPLDMRMSKEGVSARDFVNSVSEEEMTKIIREYGDEIKARQIARSIVAARKLSDIETTDELKEIIYKVTGRKRFGQKIDPATKTFQAIRIWVNKELEVLESALEQSINVLKIQGRLVTVTFHSGEDRIVKDYINQYATTIYDSIYNSKIVKPAILEKVTKKVVVASEDEVNDNVRSRSAKLRCAIKVLELEEL